MPCPKDCGRMVKRQGVRKNKCVLEAGAGPQEGSAVGTVPAITQRGQLQGTEPSAAAPHAGAVAGRQPMAWAWRASAGGAGRGRAGRVAEPSREAFSQGAALQGPFWSMLACSW